MAHQSSAMKRAKQNEKRRIRNKSYRTFYRNRIKECRKAIESGTPEEARVGLQKAVRAIDQAVAKNVLHQNTGRRYISRLTKQVNKKLNPPPSPSA